MIESKPVNLLFKDLYDLQSHGVMVDTRLVLDDGDLAIHWPILLKDRHSSDEYIEDVHCRLRRMEVRHNLHISYRTLGSNVHKERSLKSICLWNFHILASND